MKRSSSPITRSLSHLDSASNLLASAAEVATSEVHIAGLRRLSVGLALLRSPLERIAASLSKESLCTK